MSSSFQPSEGDQFSAFTIKENILDMGRRSLYLRSVSLVSVEVITPVVNWIAWLIVAGAVGYIGLLAGIENGTPIGAVLGLLVLVIPIVISFQRQKYLVIRTNDGSVSVFAGPSLESLMDIKQLIDDRLEGT